jgi:ABC-type sugar transport system substrate-binding protein
MQAGKTKMTKRLAAAVVAAAAAVTLTACGSSSDTASSSTGSAAATSAAATSKASGAASGSAAAGSGESSLAPVPDGDTVQVTLITKDSINPFFIAMQEGAKAAAEKDNVELTIAAGKADGDEDGQIQAIENAISRGDQGILIVPNGPGVNPAIVKARDAGLFVIALDTPPDPADTVDVTFATDNFKAGELIGKWTAGTLAGKPAVIALLDIFNDKIVSVDYNRDQGFLTGMGIPVNDKGVNADEAATGNYSGGTYTIVCNEPTQGTQDGGKTAMENCLSKNPDINVVYSVNEPSGQGAAAALQSAGNTDALIVSIDGGCNGVKSVTDGTFGATAQQYPLRMAQLGVDAITTIARGGEKPALTPGLSFYDTGVALVTDKPVTGLDSITSAEGTELCWG